MTPQQAKELLPIITAFANGEQIQCKNKFTGLSIWMSNTNFDFNPYTYEYRIKPKETILYSRVLKEPRGSFYFSEATREKNMNEFPTIHTLMGHNKITLLENKIVSIVFEPLEE